MDFGTNLYIRKDSGADFLGPEAPLPSVTLVVDGPTTVIPFNMVLPTEGRDKITVHMVWGWMAALSSPLVEASDMTSEQRTVLLTVACAYSAFLDLQPGVQAKDFDELARRLRDLARGHGPLAPVHSELQTLCQWLEARLPPSAFEPLSNDHFELPDPVASSEPRQKDLVANLVAMLNPAIRDSVLGIGQSATSPSSPSASRARKDRRRRAKKRATEAGLSSATSGAVLVESGTVDAIAASEKPPVLETPETTVITGLPALHTVTFTPLVPPGLSLPTPTLPGSITPAHAVPDPASRPSTTSPEVSQMDPTTTATVVSESGALSLSGGGPPSLPIATRGDSESTDSERVSRRPRATVEDAMESDRDSDGTDSDVPPSLRTVGDSSDFEESEEESEESEGSEGSEGDDSDSDVEEGSLNSAVSV